MRDTGPIVKTLTGDQDASAGLIGVARTQLGILKSRMALGGLSVGKRTIGLEDGTTITVQVAGGISSVAIDTVTPTVEGAYTEEPTVEVHSPHPPHLPVSHLQVVAMLGKLGLSKGSDEYGFYLRPISINGVTKTVADSAIRPTPLTYAVVSDPSAAPFEFQQAILVAISDGHLQIPAALPQPEKWTVSSNLVGVIVRSDDPTDGWIFGPTRLKASGLHTTPDRASLFFVPVLFADTKLTVAGNGVAGILDVKKDLRLAVDFELSDAGNTYSYNGQTYPSTFVLTPSTALYATEGMLLDVVMTGSQASGSLLGFTGEVNFLSSSLARATDADNANGGWLTPFSGVAKVEASGGGSAGNFIITNGVVGTDAYQSYIVADGFQSLTSSGTVSFYDVAGNKVSINLSITFNVTGVP